MPIDNVSLQRIEQFDLAFNAIDKDLRRRAQEHLAASGDTKQLEDFLKFESYAKALRLVKDFADVRHCYDDLTRLGKLRNSVIHDSLPESRYMSVPTEETVRLICLIRDKLLHPKSCGETFARGVIPLALTNTLAEVQVIMLERKFSQIPIIDGDRFVGLLTENGVVRWLLNHSRESQASGWGHVGVQELWDAQEKETVQCLFMAASEPDYRVGELFMEYIDLRAVLITPDGSESADFSGMATAWDVAALHADKLPRVRGQAQSAD